MHLTSVMHTNECRIMWTVLLIIHFFYEHFTAEAVFVTVMHCL